MTNTIASLLCVVPYNQWSGYISHPIADFNAKNYVIVPKNLAQQLFGRNHDTTYCLRFGARAAYCTIVDYDAPLYHIIVSEALCVELGCRSQCVKLESIDLKKIKKIIFKIPDHIVNPMAILEFKIRNLHVVKRGQMINCKIFGHSFKITVMSIVDNQLTELMIGSLYGSSIANDVEVEIVN